EVVLAVERNVRAIGAELFVLRQHEPARVEVDTLRRDACCADIGAREAGERGPDDEGVGSVERNVEGVALVCERNALGVQIRPGGTGGGRRWGGWRLPSGEEAGSVRRHDRVRLITGSRGEPAGRGSISATERKGHDRSRDERRRTQRYPSTCGSPTCDEA